MTKFWFTADYHLGHTKIIEYASRPFRNVEHMDDSIIHNHNSRVGKKDVVFHIGDFCFSKCDGAKTIASDYENMLNGKIIFIRGNHDKKNRVKTIIENMEIVLGCFPTYLVHNPALSNTNYKINLVGHVHRLWSNKVENKTVLINVGVDVRNFRPMSLEEVLKERVNILKDVKKHD